MRVLIYSETENAKRQMLSIREEGHRASLRNPQFFSSSQLESCDLVLAESENILSAYQAKGIGAEYLIEAVTVETQTEVITPQKVKRSRNGSHRSAKT
jgi:hypothetical protein